MHRLGLIQQSKKKTDIKKDATVTKKKQGNVDMSLVLLAKN